MKTATSTVAFHKDMTSEEITALSFKDLMAYKKWVAKQNDPINELLKQKANEEVKAETEELEAVEKEFAALQDLTFKVEYGETSDELSLHDALFGVKRKIMAKEKNSEEMKERDHTARLSKAEVVSIRKAIKRIVDLAKGNPMRISKDKDATDNLT